MILRGTLEGMKALSSFRWRIALGGRECDELELELIGISHCAGHSNWVTVYDLRQT